MVENTRGSTWAPAICLLTWPRFSTRSSKPRSTFRKNGGGSGSGTTNRWPGGAESNDVKLPVIPPACEQAYHMFYLLLPSAEQRDSLVAHLKAQSILSVFHYTPLHLSDAVRKFAAPSNCPVTEDISERMLRLPFYNDLSESAQEQVTSAVANFWVGALGRRAG
jgi:hypothetical protein